MYATPKRCPKCRYERQPTDAAPDWQCPSCGVAYSKVETVSSQTQTASQAVFQRRSATSGGWGKWVVTVLAIVGIYAMFARPWQEVTIHRGTAIAEAHAEQPEVVMYATSWCPYCKKARAFFNKHGIAYVEYDVEHDGKAWRENRKLGGGGVPTIVVGDKVVSGFSEPRLIQLLGPWMN